MDILCEESWLSIHYYVSYGVDQSTQRFFVSRLYTICSIIISRMRIILSLNVVHIDLFNKRAWLEILSVCTIRHLRIGSSDKRAWSEIH